MFFEKTILRASAFEAFPGGFLVSSVSNVFMIGADTSILLLSEIIIILSSWEGFLD